MMQDTRTVHGMTIYKMVEEFLVDRAVYCAPDTLRFYRESLRLFCNWGSEFGYTYPRDMDVNMVKQYCIYLREQRKIKATSIKTNFRAVNAFLHFLMENGYIPVFPYKIRLPRPDPALVLPLTSGEVEHLIATIARSNEDSLRDMLIFRLMVDCGMRSSEVRHLCLEHLDMEKRLLHVVDSKCNKSRLLPMPEAVAILLRLYLGGRYPGNGLALLDKDGGGLTVDVLKNFFRKLKKRSGIQRIHAHLLRHTFATSYMVSHNNIEYLRLYLGHEDYNVTRGYIHLASQCLLTHYDCYQIDPCFV